jgi:sensor histidine kinase YesM
MWQKNNSLIAKIMLFMSGLLVLSGIILLTLLRYTGDVLAENRQKEIGHLLNIYETSLEYGLNSTDNNLLSIAQEQKSLEELSNAEEARRYYAATDMLDIIKRLRSNNDTVDMLIAIGNYENDVSDASARLTVKDRDAIIAYMNDRRAERKDGEKMPTGTQGWIVVTVGKEQYLLRSYDTQDYSAAAWIKADTFLDQVLRLEHDTNRILALEDKEGVRIAGEAYEGTKSMEVWRKEIGKYHLILVCTVEGNTIYEQIPLLPVAILSIVLLMIGLLAWLYWYVRREIFQPIRALMYTIEYIQNGDYRHRVETRCENREFSVLNAAFNTMLDTIVELRISEYERQLCQKEAEIKYFQMQIKPHFFLNAIATIHSMSFDNRGEEIRAYIAALSDNIRYMFKAGLHTVPIAEELDHLEKYLEMQEILYPGCVFCYMDRPQELMEWQIPQMILHTFLENKYKHTVKVGNILSIYIAVKEIQRQGQKALEVTIEDDGEMFPENVIQKKWEINDQNGHGVGLYNVARTMEIMYGMPDLLKFDNISGGTKITICFPEKPII